MACANIEELLGKTLREVKKHCDDIAIFFATTDGEEYLMYHYQNCCEDVYIEDISGDLNCLINYHITLAEEVSNSNEIDWGSETWTYYKLATIKGYVTIRWYGTSNGYYSESVDFIKISDRWGREQLKQYFRE